MSKSFFICTLLVAGNIGLFVTSGFFLLLLATDAWPHDWYPAVCCNGNAEHGDCQPISSRTVKPVTGGWQITLVPGDHWMVTKPHSFFISNARVKDSPDGAFHICLYPNEDNVQCFFAPPMGV